MFDHGRISASHENHRFTGKGEIGKNWKSGSHGDLVTIESSPLPAPKMEVGN